MKTTLSIFCFLLILGCSSNDDATGFVPTLPAITQTGANTFGCYAGNILITPRNGTGTFNNTDDGMIFWGGAGTNEFNEIDVHDYRSERTSSILIRIQALHNNGVGTYPILESNGQNSIDGPDHTHVFCRIWKNETEGYRYYLSYENSGFINVTRFDLPERIVSGTFSGKLRNFNSPHDTINLTQGRFDIKWNTVSDVVFQ